MKTKLFRLLHIAALLLACKLSTAQIKAIPLSVFIFEDGHFTSVTETRLNNIICDVNRTFANQIAPTVPGFPYPAAAANAHIVFYIRSVTRIDGVPTGYSDVPSTFTADGINIFLYNYSPFGGSDVVGSYISDPSGYSAAWGSPKADVIIIGPTPFTSTADPDEARAVFSHELGHYLGLKHTDGSPDLGWTCMCPSFSGDCTTDTYPVMPENVMNSYVSAQYFFTHGQVTLMQGDLSPAPGPFGAPCRPTLPNAAMASVLAAHPGDNPPALINSQWGGYRTLTVGPGACQPGGIKFKVHFYMPGCLNGSFDYEITPPPAAASTHIAMYSPHYCHDYEIKITAVFPDGVEYVYPIIQIPGTTVLSEMCPCASDGGLPAGKVATGGEVIVLTGDWPTDSTIIASHMGAVTISNFDQNPLENILIRPNPVHDIIYFDKDLSGYLYNIIDNYGQLTRTGALQGDQLDVTQIQQGLYILQIKDQSNMILKMLQFFKQ